MWLGILYSCTQTWWPGHGICSCTIDCTIIFLWSTSVKVVKNVFEALTVAKCFTGYPKVEHAVKWVRSSFATATEKRNYIFDNFGKGNMFPADQVILSRTYTYLTQHFKFQICFIFIGIPLTWSCWKPCYRDQAPAYKHSHFLIEYSACHPQLNSVLSCHEYTKSARG